MVVADPCRRQKVCLQEVQCLSVLFTQCMHLSSSRVESMFVVLFAVVVADDVVVFLVVGTSAKMFLVVSWSLVLSA